VVGEHTRRLRDDITRHAAAYSTASERRNCAP
jgi:hypothetical protein